MPRKPPPEPVGAPAEAPVERYRRELAAELALILDARARELPPLGDDLLSRLLEVATAAAINPGSITTRQKGLSLLLLMLDYIEANYPGGRFAPFAMVLLEFMFGLQGLDEGRVEAVVQPAPRKADVYGNCPSGPPILKYPQAAEALLAACMRYEMRSGISKKSTGRKAAAKQLEAKSGIPATRFETAYKQSAYGVRPAENRLNVGVHLKDDSQLANALALLKHLAP